MDGRTSMHHYITSEFNVDINDDTCSRYSGGADDKNREGIGDHGICEMNLQDLKERNEEKKRKILKFADNESFRNWKAAHIQVKEPELDEAIHYWISRLSKEPKVVREWDEKWSSSCHLRTPGSTKAAQECNPLRHTAQDLSPAMSVASIIRGYFLCNGGDLCRLRGTTAEIVGTDKDNVNAARFPDYSSTLCTANMLLPCNSISNLPERVDAGEFEYGESTTSSEEGDGLTKSLNESVLNMRESAYFGNEFQHCSLSEGSYKHFEFGETREPTSSFTTISGESSDGLPDRVDGREAEMRSSISFTEETLHCCVNDASAQYMEEAGKSTSLIANVDFSSKLLDGLFGSASGTEPEVGEPSSSFKKSVSSCVDDASAEYTEEAEELSDGFPQKAAVELKTEESFSSRSESLPCLHNEPLTWFLESGRSTFLQESIEETFVEVTEMTNPISHHPAFEVVMESDLSHQFPTGSPEAIFVLNNPCSEIYCVRTSSSQISSCQMHSNTITQVSDTINDDDIHCTESNDTISDHFSLTASDCFCSDGDLSPMTLDMLSSSTVEETMPSSIDEVGENSSGIFNSYGTEGLTAMEAFDTFPGEKLEHPPKRLLSTRKAISPISQKKLCQAMNAEELYESIQVYNYRRKLWLERQSEAALDKENYEENGVENGHRRIVNSSSDSDEGSLPSVAKGHSNFLHTPCTEPCTCARCSLTHANAQKAITFSQRQVHDIEDFVIKLVKGLMFMKQVMEENLQSQPIPSTTSEMKKAIDNAVRLEKDARRWISTMSKDCNRFCRIMVCLFNFNLILTSSFGSSVSVMLPLLQNLTGDTGTANTGVYNSRRKKVKFADEVGHSLSHVKVFEKYSASVNSLPS